MKIFPTLNLKRLTFVPIAPCNLGLIRMPLMVFLFAFSMNLKDTVLVEDVHSLERLIKQLLSDVLIHVDQ